MCNTWYGYYNFQKNNDFVKDKHHAIVYVTK